MPRFSCLQKCILQKIAYGEWLPKGIKGWKKLPLAYFSTHALVCGCCIASILPVIFCKHRTAANEQSSLVWRPSVGRKTSNGKNLSIGFCGGWGDAAHEIFAAVAGLWSSDVASAREASASHAAKHDRPTTNDRWPTNGAVSWRYRILLIIYPCHCSGSESQLNLSSLPKPGSGHVGRYMHAELLVYNNSTQNVCSL